MKRADADIPLSLEEITLIADALTAYSVGLSRSTNLSYPFLTSKGVRKAEDRRVAAEMLRGEIFKRLKATDV